MINKLKTLIDPIRQKLCRLHLGNIRNNKEESADPSWQEEKTLKMGETELPTDLPDGAETNKGETDDHIDHPEQQPGFVRNLFDRLSSLFKRVKVKPKASEPENAAPALVIQNVKTVDVKTVDVQLDIEAEELDAKSHWIFQGVKKRIVWIPALLLILSGMGGTLTVLALNKISAQGKALHDLQKEAKKLEQENLALKRPSTKVPFPEAKPALADLSVPAVSRQQYKTASKENALGGDCVLSDKTHVRESLKSCIEAFNATGNRLP